MMGIDARGVQLRDLKLRRLERFVYEYDFGDSWIHDLRLEATLPVDPRKTYPVCVAGKCSAPPEDCGGPAAFMANRQSHARVSRGASPEELDDFADEFDEEEADILSDYNSDRFDRRGCSRCGDLGGTVCPRGLAVREIPGCLRRFAMRRVRSTSPSRRRRRR
jgi:hypothetical protein